MSSSQTGETFLSIQISSDFLFLRFCLYFKMLLSSYRFGGALGMSCLSYISLWAIGVLLLSSCVFRTVILSGYSWKWLALFEAYSNKALDGFSMKDWSVGMLKDGSLGSGLGVILTIGWYFYVWMPFKGFMILKLSS